MVIVLLPRETRFSMPEQMAADKEALAEAAPKIEALRGELEEARQTAQRARAGADELRCIGYSLCQRCR